MKSTRNAIKLAGAKLVHPSDRLDVLREAVESGATDAELREMDATGRVLRVIRYTPPEPPEARAEIREWPLLLAALGLWCGMAWLLVRLLSLAAGVVR